MTQNPTGGRQRQARKQVRCNAPAGRGGVPRTGSRASQSRGDRDRGTQEGNFWTQDFGKAKIRRSMCILIYSSR